MGVCMFDYEVELNNKENTMIDSTKKSRFQRIILILLCMCIYEIMMMIMMYVCMYAYYNVSGDLVVDGDKIHLGKIKDI